MWKQNSTAQYLNTCTEIQRYIDKIEQETSFQGPGC